MKLKIFLLGFALVAVSLGYSQFPAIHGYHQDVGNLERSRSIDVTHMKVEATLFPKEKKVIGTVTHQFKSLQTQIDTLFFDAPGIQVHSVVLNGKTVAFRTNSQGLIVESKMKPPYLSENQIMIRYTAFPQKGLYFIGWNFDTIEEPAHMTRQQVWTQGQGIDNRHWIPMMDDRSDKFTTETIITFHQDFRVLSNGTLVSVKENKSDKTKTWHYSLNKPHAGYLLMVAIDRYAIKKSKSKKGIEHQFWYYPEHPERLEPTSRYSEEILDFLSDEIGVPYPWGSYSQVMVQDFLYGAMENTTATIFGDFFWVDSRAYLLNRNYVSVNAHEATHQWFGDFITGRKDNEQWLQESFATFYPGLVEGHLFSKEHEYWYFRNHQKGAIAAGKPNSLPVRHSQSGSSRHYSKGAFVLYMLQHQVGRDNFRRAIKHYLDQYAYKTVETWDLQKAFIDATGINVDAFFDQWIHRGGEPKFKVSYTEGKKHVNIQIDQVHIQDAVVKTFETPVNMAIYFKNGQKYQFTHHIRNLSETIQLPLTDDVDFILFDEGSFLLKELEFTKTTAQYLSQFQHAQYMLDRYDALMELRNVAPETKRSLLVQALTKETFPFIRAEIASQLLRDSQLPANVLQMLSQDKQAEVRLAFATHAPIQKSTEALLETLLKDSSYVIIETVFDRMYEHPAYALRKTAILDNIATTDGFTHGIKIKYLEKAHLQYPEMGPSMLKALVNFSGPKYEFRTRTLAIQALQRLNYFDETLAHHLFEAASNFNSRLGGIAWDALSYMSKQTKALDIMKKSVFTWKSDLQNAQQTRLKVLNF
jgi:aminopeptidase N